MAKKRDDPDETPVAIKRLKKSVLIRQKQVDHILSERKVLGAVHHPFLVSNVLQRLTVCLIKICVCIRQVELLSTFKDDRFLYIILEYVPGGEFFTHLRKSRRFENDTSRFYAAQVCLLCIF